MRAQDPFIGRDILNGQFQILQKIGSGGMGAVYKASQPEMNRMVGVKILHPKLANRKDLVSRFRREARAMSQLTHPNTAKVFLYGELEDGSLYIIMEFLEGRNLNQTVRSEGAFPLERGLPILVQVCGALQEAHQAGIVHRDLKPENIFLVQSGTLRDFPKVLDFGLAKVGERQMRPGSVVLTQEGMVFGTPEFMSPEQAQGKTLTSASDIYSLAVILYEVLTGKLPFDARGTMDFIQLHVMGEPVPINQRVAGRTFPVALEQIVARALAKRPEERFATAADFAAALEGVLEASRAVGVRPSRAAAPPEGPTTASVRRPPANSTGPRHPRPESIAHGSARAPTAAEALAPARAHGGDIPARTDGASTSTTAGATRTVPAREVAPDPAQATLPQASSSVETVPLQGAAVAQVVAASRPEGRAARAVRSSASPNVALLVAVAVTFLALGVGLALVLVHYVIR